MSGIRVVVVDDQPLMRAGFRMILEAQPDIQVVGEAADGAEAVDVTAALAARRGADGHPDAGHGRCRGDAPSAGAARRVLILTTFDLDEYVVDALQAGASGFLIKDAPPEELVNAVRVVARGDALLAPTVTRRLLDRVVPTLNRPEPPAAGALAELTDRELQVLRLVALGMTNAEIAAQLVVTEATVKTHVSHLLAKLGLRNRVQAVVLAYQIGLVAPG